MRRLGSGSRSGVPQREGDLVPVDRQVRRIKLALPVIQLEVEDAEAIERHRLIAVLAHQERFIDLTPVDLERHLERAGRHVRAARPDVV